MNRFFKELNRRNVTRVALLYVGVSWLLIQIAETVLPIFDVSTQFLRVLVTLLVIGFVVAVALAWVFEVSPDGIKKDDGNDPLSDSESAGRGMNLAIGVVLLACVAAFVSNQAGWFSPVEDSETASGSEDALAPGEDADIDQGNASELVRGVAVLPFENLSEAQENAFFAVGVHDEILTNLATIRNFRVISRTSVRGYADTLLRIPDIARELGVSHVMEGSVRRSRDRVRVTVLLIDAVNDEQIWSASYDRTLVDIFDIQSDIAKQIVANIQGELSPQLPANIGMRSTSNTTAYELYLQARAGIRSDVRSAETLKQPLKLIRQALEVDPNFVEAWVELVAICGGMVWWDQVEYKTCAREALEQVQRLAPESPRRVLAEGIYSYRVKHDFDGAFHTLKSIASDLPNDATLWLFIGYSARRSGRWSEALDALRKVMLLDPLDQTIHDDFLVTLTASGDWPQAIKFGELSGSKFPDNKLLPFLVADLKRKHLGDLSQYAVTMAQLPPQLRTVHGNPWIKDAFASHEQRLAWIAEGLNSGVGLSFWKTGADSTFHMLNDRPQQAEALGQQAYREFIEAFGEEIEGLTRFPLSIAAMVAARANEQAAARRALALYETLVEGDRDQIMELNQFFVFVAYAHLGELDQAWAQLQQMLATPLGLTAWDLKQDAVIQHYFSDYPPFIEFIRTTAEQR